MDISKDSILIKNFRLAVKKFNKRVKLIKTMGGSDASILNRRRIETVNVGVGYINPHSVDEKIKVLNVEP